MNIQKKDSNTRKTNMPNIKLHNCSDSINSDNSPLKQETNKKKQQKKPF